MNGDNDLLIAAVRRLDEANKRLTMTQLLVDIVIGCSFGFMVALAAVEYLSR